jgi:glycosyltransferase involved in cell wall biosynthesis
VNLRDAHIGYVGYSTDFRAPGDRRRFCAYAAHSGLAYESARLSRDYDLVLLTHNGDIPGWTARKRRERGGFKLVFELADSYFAQTNPVRRLLKGVGRFALGMDSRLSPDFLKTLVHACECADAVICSTDEQRATVGRYNPKVFTSFDYFADDLGPPKQDYSQGDKLRLVWEGQSTTLWNIQTIRDLLNDRRDKVQLHVVTDPVIHRYFGRFGVHPSVDALRGIECEILFRPWRLESFSADITNGDLAIIPIDLSNPFARGKPENKLIMMWQLGMPVLASATPAYERTMRASGVDMLCSSAAEWSTQLDRLIAAGPSELERIATIGRAFAERAYSKAEFARRFDEVFEAVGFEVV